ncbi:IS30 family transposase [Jiangella anatolica]|uniref:IS30 family transposase n=2 Tax=Jiangella anatolica TaxID=2670374 RepID=A0A2W2BN31_9ACTN|nr:IS30 family transposase [Jiangella anatolica]
MWGGGGVVAARLSLVEREEIAVGRAREESVASIAARLGRAVSTISREIAKLSFEWLGQPYRAVAADETARLFRARPRRGKLVQDSPLRRAVIDKLQQRWSPEQISAWLAVEYAGDAGMQVSHETIYQAVYLQARGNLRAELSHQKALRTGRVRRQARTSAAGALRSARPWVDLHISARPAEAADRAVPGHWEGDLLVGARNHSVVATLVERSSRYVRLVALPDGKISEFVAAQLAEAMRALPASLRRTLTWDQGSEMADHATFTLATGIEVYFCDPHSPWQRGSNENTNRLLRDYFPKGSTDFTTLTQADLDTVADQLNTRPRHTLNWQTPAQRLNQLLVATTT